MKYFKNIKVIENKPSHKIVTTSNEDNNFIIEFVLKNNIITTSFYKDFILNDLKFIDKVKTCFKVLFNKKITLSSTFKFKNGEHVVDVSDTLYIYSKEIRKN